MIWKQVPGVIGLEASDRGDLRRNGRTISQQKTTRGYLRVKLMVNGKLKGLLVHRCVLKAFRGEPKPCQQCAHGDGVRTNNNINNLRWATHKENQDDKMKHGKFWRGEDNNFSKLTNAQARQILKDYRRPSYFVSNAVELSNKYGVSVQQIMAIISGKCWAWLKEDNK